MVLRSKGTLVVSVCLLIGLVLVLSFDQHESQLYSLLRDETEIISDPMNGTNLSTVDPTALHVGTGSSSDKNLSRGAVALSPTVRPQHPTPVTVADLYKHLVCVTAFSDNHFDEAKDLIAGFQTCLPDKPIIVYDLGLNSGHRKEIGSYCNVELRSFPFEDYENLTHVKRLHNYAWKPIITKQMSLEYEVILYGDSSLRMKSCNITKALAYLFKFPFLDIYPLDYRAIEFTHDGMIEYLHYPESRKAMAHVETLQGGCWLMWANTVMKDKLIEPWLDCALHGECIAPEGAKKLPCHFTNKHDGHYVDCHRFDQSALNLILAREFGMDSIKKGANVATTLSIWDITRNPTHMYNISLCT